MEYIPFRNTYWNLLHTKLPLFFYYVRVYADHVKVIAEMNLSDNFYGWVFAYGGSMQITSRCG